MDEGMAQVEVVVAHHDRGAGPDPGDPLAGAAVRQLHDAPLPPWPSKRGEDRAESLEVECAWLVANDVLPADLVARDRELAEAAQGDAAYDLASLTLGHPERLDQVAAGYGAGVDLEAVRGWWSLRSLTAIPWLVEHGFDPFLPGCEVDVLRAQDRLSRQASNASADVFDGT